MNAGGTNSGGANAGGAHSGGASGGPTDASAGGAATDANEPDGGRVAICGPTFQVCQCATGAYCLAGNAQCISADSPCPPPPNDGGASASGCGICAPGTVCVRNQVIGGAFIPPDAGRCPDGRVMVPESPNSCALPPTYYCAPIPAVCGGTPTCTCAASLCQYPCETADANLVFCLERVP